MTKRRKHVEPHFDEYGGCTCKCRECVRVEMRHIDDPEQPMSLRQVCCCSGCTGSCPGIGRVASVSIDPSGLLAQRSSEGAVTVRMTVIEPVTLVHQAQRVVTLSRGDKVSVEIDGKWFQLEVWPAT